VYINTTTSSVSIVTRLRAGRSGFDRGQGQRWYFSFRYRVNTGSVVQPAT